MKNLNLTLEEVLKTSIYHVNDKLKFNNVYKHLQHYLNIDFKNNL
jgi:hypothetical protein